MPACHDPHDGARHGIGLGTSGTPPERFVPALDHLAAKLADSAQRKAFSDPLATSYGSAADAQRC